MNENVILNEYGYYTLAQIPTKEELSSYYAKEYYQSASEKIGRSSYDKIYTDDEIKFFKAKLQQKQILIEKYLDKDANKPSFIDIGCGEGFAVKFFYDSGYDVVGLDYSIYGVEHNNPEIIDKIICGDVMKSLEHMIHNHSKYDVINMDNLLEHVTDPLSLLKICYNLITDKGVILIKVPNDFSYLQQYLLNNSIINKPIWVTVPDHISYFNKDGLISLCKAVGLKNKIILGNYLTEFSALNPNTNYLKHPELGKSCHLARVAQENIFHDISPEKTIELYTILGEMGLGREIIGVFQKS